MIKFVQVMADTLTVYIYDDEIEISKREGYKKVSRALVSLIQMDKF